MDLTIKTTPLLIASEEAWGDNEVHAAFNPAGDLLVSAHNKGSLTWWDADSGSRVSERASDYRFGSVSFHPDGSTVVTGTWDGKLIWWDTQNWMPVQTVSTEEPFEFGGALDLAFNADGSLLACAGSLLDGSLIVYDGNRGEVALRLRDHRDYVTAVAFSPDGQLLASGTQYDDGLIRLWHVKTQEVVSTINPHGPGYTSTIISLAFSPDGKSLYANDWAAVQVWGLSSGSLLQKFDGKGPEAPFALRPDGKVIAFGATEYNQVQLVDVSTEAVLAVIDNHHDHICTLVFNRQGTLLVSGDRQGNLFRTEISDFSEKV